MNSTHPLVQLRDQLASPEDSFGNPELYSRLSLVESEGLIHVDFYGDPFESAFSQLCEILCAENIAPTIASLTLRCPDEGANGTCNWNLTGLLEGGTPYSALEMLSIQQNKPSDHNRIVVAADFDEDGVLAKILRKAPMLDALISPSAPDASFFAQRHDRLRYLNVDAGYDTQDFISNLANSNCFPSLRSLEFGEYNETYLDTFPQGCTPFDDYKRLFQSTAFASVQNFTWRNPVCNVEEVSALRALRPARDLQFKVIRTSSEYVE